MTAWWILGAVLLALAAAWLIFRFRQNKAASEAEASPESSTQGEFEAVAIRYSEHACNAAKAMTGRRFLATEPPQLPLKECDYDDCRCTFSRFSDRRSNANRRAPFAGGGQAERTGTFEREKRKRTDRRKNTKT
jgi:hypothetical protein